jgi:hypothetical protein
MAQLGIRSSAVLYDRRHVALASHVSRHRVIAEDPRRQLVDLISN